MYELERVGERTYYINCPAKIGVYKVDEENVVLIDTGNDKEAAKKILRIAEAEGWTIQAIYNTHANADHIGGNQWIQKKTGCPIFAPQIETYFTIHPELESAFLYGGYPQKALKNKFLMAPSSEATILTPENICEGLEMISLPGHYFEMVGFRTSDDVVFLADCLFGENIIDKYHLTFVYDTIGYLETLEAVKRMEAACFIPSHAEATADIVPLAQKNIDKVHEILNLIKATCHEGLHFEAILKAVLDHYGLMLDLNQYVLVGSTIRSYLSYLVDQGQMTCFVSENYLLWKSV